mgnify:FL=1
MSTRKDPLKIGFHYYNSSTDFPVEPTALPPHFDLFIDVLNRQNPHSDRKIKGIRVGNLPIASKQGYQLPLNRQTSGLRTHNHTPLKEGGKIPPLPRYNQ